MVSDMGERLSNRIRQIRKERGLSQEQLALALGDETSIATISRLESGRMTLSLSWMNRIAKILEVEPYQLIIDLPVRTVPIMGEIAAGMFVEAYEENVGFMPLAVEIGGKRSFALKVSGDSMDKIAKDGSFIVVDPDQVALDDERLYAIRNADGEATFKQYRSDPPRLEPVSTNEEHQPILVGQSPFVVIGRVIYIANRV